MSPAKPTLTQEQASPTPMTNTPDVKIRKRVRKACDRCRIKKTKCDGSSPCLRCKTDNVICCAKTSHRFRRRNFPPGYTEMLEKQHSQLVACVQELYQRARKAGSWDPLLPGDLDRYPSVHDILAALDLLEPKDDGSRDFEPFNELLGSSRSDNGTTASVHEGVVDSQDDQHDSIPAQSNSPSLPSEDTTPCFPGTPALEPDSTISSRPPTSSEQSMEVSPLHSDQTTAALPSISRAPYSQSLAEYTQSQARLFATLSTAPLNSSFYNTSNVPVQYGKSIASTSTTATTPPLSLDPQVMQQDYTPSYHQRSMTASSDTLPFCHDWTRSGIKVDDSDFSTDFRRLSQLDVGMGGGGGEGAGLVPGIMPPLSLLRTPIDEAKECWTSWDDHRSSSEWYQYQSTTELASTEEWVRTSVDSDVSLTTLCDGKARALEPYKTAVITETETLETPTLTTFTRDYTEPSPTCFIGESACSSLLYTRSLNLRHCDLAQTYPPCAATSAPCDVRLRNDGHSTLLYWSISTQSGDFCAQNGITAFAMPASPPQPNTAVIDGFTFTSPTNYISFDAMSAAIRTKIGRSYYRLQCGGSLTRNVVVPITESFYSAANYAGYGDSTYSFNFADLNTVPAEAYSKQYKCGYNGEPESCVGVMAYQASYTPIVVMPGLTYLDPEWKAAGCGGPGVAFSLTQVALATPTPP